MSVSIGPSGAAQARRLPDSSATTLAVPRRELRLLVERVLGDLLAGDPQNWQSEFLQVSSFVIAAGYLVWTGSNESPDGGERLEAKSALSKQAGINPADVHETLPAKYRPKVGGKG
jgi:hypothetical protein